MFLHKKTFLKYKNICTFMSFNTNVLNKSIWKIRNYIRYIFFFLVKKSFFLKLLFLYKLFFFIIIIKKSLQIEIKNIYFYLFNNILNNNFLFLKNYYLKYYLLSNSLNNNALIFINILNIYNSLKIKTNIIFYYNYFYFLYKTFLFIIYIWLYSLKYFNFYKLNVGTIPISDKKFTVLRSPHKDKKAREKFKIHKIKKTMSFPSFISNDVFFSNILNETISIQYQINVKKN